MSQTPIMGQRTAKIITIVLGMALGSLMVAGPVYANRPVSPPGQSDVHGKGQFRGVPGPVAGSGLLAVVAAGGLLVWLRRRRASRRKP